VEQWLGDKKEKMLSSIRDREIHR